MTHARKALVALDRDAPEVPANLRPGWIDKRETANGAIVYVYADGSLLYVPRVGPRMAYPHEPEYWPDETDE